MENTSGGGGSISAEFMQNIQSAVDASGVIGQVQVIETDEGPMTVIFMEEGADASALTNSQIFTDAGLTIGDGSHIQYTVADSGDTSHTHIQYVDDEGNPVDPLQYGLAAGDGSQLQYQFIESTDDYTGLLGNIAADTVGIPMETNLSQDENAVAVDPVISLPVEQHITGQQISDHLSAHQLDSCQSSENQQVSCQQSAYQQVSDQESAYQQVLSQEDALQQVLNKQVPVQQTTYQISNQQTAGQPVSDNIETLLQATSEGGETLYITESGEIIKIDTSLLGTQFSTNDGSILYETGVQNSPADEHYVATKLQTDQLASENVLSITQPYVSTVQFAALPKASAARIVTKPGMVTSQNKPSYTHKVVSNSAPAAGRSLLSPKTAASFNLKSISNTQSTSKKQPLLLPFSANQKPQVLTFKSNDTTYIIKSFDSESAANAGVGNQTKSNSSSATIVKPQLTAQTIAMKKQLQPIAQQVVTSHPVISQTKQSAPELNKGNMTSLSPMPKVQTMTTIMKSRGTSTTLTNTDRLEYKLSKSAITSAAVKKPLQLIAKQPVKTMGIKQTVPLPGITVKNVAAGKPTTLMPQVSKQLIADTQADVKQYGVSYKTPLQVITDVKQQTHKFFIRMPEADQPDSHSVMEAEKPERTEVDKLNATTETKQTLSDDGISTANALVSGNESFSLTGSSPNKITIYNKLYNDEHVKDLVVTATDVLPACVNVSSAVAPLDVADNEIRAGIDVFKLQAEAISSKSVTDSGELRRLAPSNPIICTEVINARQYEDVVPVGLEMYKPIFNAYQCGICSEEFAVELIFKKHHLHKHTEKLTCLACNQNFRSNHILNNHMTLMHTVGKPLICPVCSLGFLKSSLYWAHASRHASLFKCNICLQVFNCNVELQRHTMNVHIEKNLKCGLCGQVFRSKEEVDEHKRLKHGVEEHKSQPELAVVKDAKENAEAKQDFLEEEQSLGESSSDQSKLALYIDNHGQLTSQQIVQPVKVVDKPLVAGQVTEQKQEVVQGTSLEQPSGKTDRSEVTVSSQSDNSEKNELFTIENKQSSSGVGEKIHSVVPAPRMKSIEVPDSDVTIQLYADGTLVTSDKSGTNYSKVRLEDLGLDHTMLQGNTNIELLIVQGDGKEVRAIINTNMQSEIQKSDSVKQSPEFEKDSQEKKKSHDQPLFDDEDGELRATTDDSRPYKCSMCPRTFKFYRTFKCHEIVHTKAETYTCPLCKRLFARENNLKSHLQLHEKKAAMQRMTAKESQSRDDKIWHCEHCGQSFTAHTNMLRHVRQQHENTAGVVCTICDKRFLNEANVQRHIKTHVGPFPCSYCESKYDVHDELANHMKEQHEDKLFKCKCCLKMLLSKKSLITHISENHSNTSAGKEQMEDLKKYACEECGLKFTKMAVLIKHKVVHDKVDEYKCNECTKAFNVEWKLAKHQKTHESPTIYKCPDCDEGFNFPHLLENHKNAYHQGPYPCDCTEEFASRLHLEEHQYDKHDGGFPCAKCDKKLKNSIELDKHSNTEHITVGNSFLCENCGEAFEHKPQLKTHLLKKHYNASKASMFKEYPEMRTVHDELTCEICDTYCKNKTAYKQHFKDEHFDGDADAMYEVCPELRKFPNPPEPVVCDHCGKSCTNLMYLNMHLKVHGISVSNKEMKDIDESDSADVEEDSDEDNVDFENTGPQDAEKKYNCKECGEKFARQAAWIKHTKSHEKDDLNEDLQRDSIDASALAKSPKRKTYICSECQDVFKTITELRIHKKTHASVTADDTGEELPSAGKILFDAKRRECKSCDKCFASSYNLKRHLQHIHEMNIDIDSFSESDQYSEKTTPGSTGPSAAKRYKSQKRGAGSSLKTFNRSSKSTDDGNILEDGTDISTFLGMNFNLEKTPSQCNIASVKKKCHKCTICGKGFSREATLKKHLLLHEECNDSEFDMRPERSHDLMADLQRALYPCETCGNMYSTAGGLIYHSRVKHPEVDEDAVVTKVNEITDKLKADKMEKIKDETKDSVIKTAQKRKLSEFSEKMDELERKKMKLDELEKPTFPCQHCEAVYMSSNGLFFHENAFHPGKAGPASEGNVNAGRQSLSGRVIKKNSRYEEHVRCNQCSKLFDDVSNYRRHVKAVHKGERKAVTQLSVQEDHGQKCEHCDKTFLGLINLRRHLKMKHGISFEESKPNEKEEPKETAPKENAISSAIYNCDVCEQKCSSLNNFRNHMMMVHDENDEYDFEVKEETFECSVCRIEFASKQILDIHMREHSGEKPYECSICGKRRISKHKLELHLKKFHRKELLRKITCKICLFLFDTENEMLKHMVIHRKLVEEKTSVSTPSVNKCLKCNKVFRWKRNLVSHARLFHKDADPLTCGICNKLFPDRESIKEHLKEHQEQKRTCETCKKCFSKESHLKQHEAIVHKSCVSLSCDICKQSFGTKQRLLEHMLSHTSIMPHKCDICSASFKAGHLLKVHKLSHNLKEKHKQLNLKSVKSDTDRDKLRAVCKRCNRMFSTEWNLKLHVAKSHRRGSKNKTSLKAKQLVAIASEAKEKMSPKTEFKENILKVEVKEKATTKTEQESKPVAKKVAPSPLMKPSDVKLKSHLTKQQPMIKSKLTDQKKISLTKPKSAISKSPVLKIKTALQKRALRKQAAEIAKTSYGTKEKSNVQENVKSNGHCTTCNLDFASSKLYQKHMKHTHSETFPSPLSNENNLIDSLCPICKSVYSNRGNLKRHLEMLHNVQFDKVPSKSTKNVQCVYCSECNRVFWYKDQFELHLRKTHPDKAALQLDNEHPGGVIKTEVEDVGPLSPKHGEPDIEKMRRKCEFCNRIHWTKKSFEDHILKFHPEHAEMYRPQRGLSEMKPEIELVDDSEETNKYLSVHLFENMPVEKLSAYPVVMIERMPCGMALIHPVATPGGKLLNDDSNHELYASVGHENDNSKITVKCVADDSDEYKFDDVTITTNDYEEHSPDQNKKTEDAAEKLVIENVRHIENTDKVCENEETEKFSKSFQNDEENIHVHENIGKFNADNERTDKIASLYTFDRENLEIFQTSDSVKSLESRLIQNKPEDGINETENDISDESKVEECGMDFVHEKKSFEIYGKYDFEQSKAGENCSFAENSQDQLSDQMDISANVDKVYNACEESDITNMKDIITSVVYADDLQEVKTSDNDKYGVVIINESKGILIEVNTEPGEHILDNLGEGQQGNIHIEMTTDDDKRNVDKIDMEKMDVTEHDISPSQSNSKLGVIDKVSETPEEVYGDPMNLLTEIVSDVKRNDTNIDSRAKNDNTNDNAEENSDLPPTDASPFNDENKMDFD